MGMLPQKHVCLLEEKLELKCRVAEVGWLSRWCAFHHPWKQFCASLHLCTQKDNFHKKCIAWISDFANVISDTLAHGNACVINTTRTCWYVYPNLERCRLYSLTWYACEQLRVQHHVWVRASPLLRWCVAGYIGLHEMASPVPCCSCQQVVQCSELCLTERKLIPRSQIMFCAAPYGLPIGWNHGTTR